MGTNKVKKCPVRKIVFCTGLTRAAIARQKSIVPAREPLNQPKKDHFHMYSNSPNLPQFQPQSTYFPRYETGLVCLQTQLERTLQLYW
jgi:hypothetical protein